MWQWGVGGRGGGGAYEGEGVWRGSPATDGREGPSLEHFLRVLIHAHDALSRDAKQARDKLVPPLHLLLRGGGGRQHGYQPQTQHAS